MNTPKYILHASPEKDKEGKNVPKLIKKGGFKYIKGRPTTSSDISYIALHATDLGQRKGEKPETKGQLWHIFCMDLPKDKHVGTSAHGNIEIIDDEEKKSSIQTTNINSEKKNKKRYLANPQHEGVEDHNEGFMINERNLQKKTCFQNQTGQRKQ